jgi:hypothetical protein
MPDYDYHGLMASTWDIWRDDPHYCVLGER